MANVYAVIEDLENSKANARKKAVDALPTLLDEPAKEPEPEDAVQSRRTLMRAASQRRSLRLREQTLPGAGSSRNLEAPAELAAPALLPPPVSQGSMRMGRQDTFVDEHLASRASYRGGLKGRPPRAPGRLEQTGAGSATLAGSSSAGLTGSPAMNDAAAAQGEQEEADRLAA